MRTICRAFTALVLIIHFGFQAGAQLKELEPSGEWKLVGQVKYAGPAKASLKYLATGKDTSYLLLMRDDRYELKEFFSITFNGSGGTLESFQKLLFSFFEDEHKKDRKYEKTFSLGATLVHVQHYKRLTGATIMLTTKEGYILFTKNELEKLFNV